MDGEIERKLNEAGYRLLNKDNEIESLILNILKTKNTRYLKSIPFLIYPALKDGWPTINITFIFAVVGSVIAFTYAKTLALRSLRSSLMSDVVPLAFFAVLFQYVLGLIFLSESIKILSIIGLIFIVFGGYILKAAEAKEDFLKPFKLLISNNESRAYLLAMIITAVASIFDKISIKNIQPINQSFVLLIENILTTILLTGYLIRKDKNWTRNLKNNFWTLYRPLANEWALFYNGMERLIPVASGGKKAIDIINEELFSLFNKEKT